MNPENPTPREQLEARLTALLLGELPADEADTLRVEIANNADLRALFHRLQQTIELVQQTASEPEQQADAPPALLKMSEAKREQLLAQFKTVRPKEFVRRNWWETKRISPVTAVAAAAAVVLFVAILTPNLRHMRTSSMANSVINNLRQLDGAKQQWAMEQKAPATAEPTMSDVEPYMGRGQGGLPASVVGETYVLGKVNEAPSAEIDPSKNQGLLGKLFVAPPENGAGRKRMVLDDDQWRDVNGTGKKSEGEATLGLGYVREQGTSTFAATNGRIDSPEITGSDFLPVRTLNPVKGEVTTFSSAPALVAAPAAPSRANIVLPSSGEQVSAANTWGVTATARGFYVDNINTGGDVVARNKASEGENLGIALNGNLGRPTTDNFSTGQTRDDVGGFRFYTDLNRNGTTDTAGAGAGGRGGGMPAIIDGPRGVRGTNSFGDPEWVGILDHPDARHSSSNQFVGRYAYVVLPNSDVSVDSFTNRGVINSGNMDFAPGQQFAVNQTSATDEIARRRIGTTSDASELALDHRSTIRSDLYSPQNLGEEERVRRAEPSQPVVAAGGDLASADSTTSVVSHRWSFNDSDSSTGKEDLVTRTLKVDPQAFNKGLSSVTGIPFGNGHVEGFGGGGGVSGGGGYGGAGSLSDGSIQQVTSSGFRGGTVSAGNFIYFPGGNEVVANGGGFGGGGGNPNSAEVAQEQARNFFRAAGVDLSEKDGKAVFYNDRTGELTIRGTAKDVEMLQEATKSLQQGTPPISVRAGMAEVTPPQNKGEEFRGQTVPGTVPYIAGTYFGSINGQTNGQFAQSGDKVPALGDQPEVAFAFRTQSPKAQAAQSGSSARPSLAQDGGRGGEGLDVGVAGLLSNSNPGYATTLSGSRVTAANALVSPATPLASTNGIVTADAIDTFTVVNGTLGVPAKSDSVKGVDWTGTLQQTVTVQRNKQATEENKKVQAQTLVQDGRALLEAGRPDEAESRLKAAIAKDPSNEAAYQYLRLVAEKQAGQTNRNQLTSANAMVMVEDEWNVDKRTALGLPKPNTFNRTNMVYTGKGRQEIIAKLDKIHVDDVKYPEVELKDVLAKLSEVSKSKDPDKKGINFFINNPNPQVSTIDPTTQLPVASVDISKTKIRVNLENVRLADVIDAITRTADFPIKYSVLDYAVVFSAKDDDTVGNQQSAAQPAKPKEQEPPPVRKPSGPPPVPQPEVLTRENTFSTFSLNVSDVSFKLAGASLDQGMLPDPASIRSEEFINAFDYRDPEPPAGARVAFAWERARYPFAQNRDLLRFSIKTAALGRQRGRPMNIVLLLDKSGSMERADRVRITREALRVLASQLGPQDRVSVVTFARTARLWVDGIPGNTAGEVLDQAGGLTPEGGTNLEDAMNLAYATALRHYMANGVNRVVLLTDGAANLGDVDPDSLEKKVETNRKQGIALDCFGIGWEGFNDDLLEVLSRHGDGRYGFINTPEEAADGFAAQLAGALRVAAADVKVQVEFNPKRVTAYRQIGYAKHQLTKEQFRDNTVDAAEIGAAEEGNALYTVEVNPAGEGPLATVRVRYKVPETGDFREQAWTVPCGGNAMALEDCGATMRLAATSSAFSEWLAQSPFAQEVTPDRLLTYLNGVPEIYGADVRPKKLEAMIRQAKAISGK